MGTLRVNLMKTYWNLCNRIQFTTRAGQYFCAVAVWVSCCVSPSALQRLGLKYCVGRATRQFTLGSECTLRAFVALIKFSRILFLVGWNLLRTPHTLAAGRFWLTCVNAHILAWASECIVLGSGSGDKILQHVLYWNWNFRLICFQTWGA